MEFPSQVDVTIVGGGPSGVVCAYMVAKAGYKVVILDKKSRDKIGDKTCGDAVDKAALDRLHQESGLSYPSGNEVSDIIEKMSIGAGDVDCKISLDAPGYLVDRLNYGQRLLQNAESVGVTIIPQATVRDILYREENDIRFVSGVKFKHNGKIHEIGSHFTIDASGSYAVIRKQLPEEFFINGLEKELKDVEIWPTYREIIQLNENQSNHRWMNEILLLYKDDFPIPGYFWIFSKGNHQLNVGIGWSKVQNLGKMKDLFRKELSNYYSENDYSVIKSGGGQIPIRPPFDSLVFNGGALAGDAACMVHPITAEGHGPALDTAMRLGKTLINALKQKNYTREGIWDYNVAVAKHYGRKHTESELFKRFLIDIEVSGLEFLIKKKVFNEEELNLVFSGETIALSKLDIFKRFLILLQKPKILFKIRSIFRKTDVCKKIYSEYPTNPSEIDSWRKKRNSTLGLSY